MQAKTKRRIKRTLLVTTLLFVATAGTVLYLLQRPPSVWREAQAVLQNASPQMRQTVTQRIKDRIDSDASQTSGNTETLAEVPLDEFAEITLTNDELILIVNDFFVEWTKQRGYIIPGGINDPAVLAKDGRLILTFMIQTPHWQQVFSGEMSLDFKPDGMAIGKMNNLYAGSLPLSIITIGQTLRLHMPESEHETADRLGKWLAKLDHFSFRPTIELDHRRRARVLAMDVGDRDVTLKLRVQDHQTYRAHNTLLDLGEIAVTDVLKGAPQWDGTAIADVPTTTE